MKCKLCARLGEAFAASAHNHLRRVQLFSDAVEQFDAERYQIRRRDMDESRIELAIAETELKRHRKVHLSLEPDVKFVDSAYVRKREGVT